MSSRLRFTKAAIEALTPPPVGKKARYFDTVEPGLVLRVTPTGARSFYLYKKVGGRPVEQKLGTYPDLTIEQARTRVLEARRSLATEGRLPDAAKKAGEGMAFGELGAWWLTYAEGRKRSAKFDGVMLASYFAPWRHRALADIRRADAEALHEAITKKHGAQAANRAMELARAMFNRAIRKERFAGPNPVAGIEWNAKVERDRRLNPDEVRRFFEALEAHPHAWMRDFVLLSLYTGARQANVCAMRFDEVDLAGRFWRIPDSKSGQPLILPLGDEELAAVRRRRAAVEGPWVFPGPGASGHLVEPRRPWEAIREAAGLPDLRMHDLRRTLGSYLADTGSSLHLIGKALGHKSQGATAIYARFALDPIRQAKAKAHAAIQEHRGVQAEAVEPWPVVRRRRVRAGIRRNGTSA